MIKDFLLLLSFMSRIPIKSKLAPTSEDWARALRFLPLWGLVLGIAVAAVAAVTSIISPAIAAACAVGTAAFLTGGLHLDGVMDVSDGLAAGPDREQAFRFMSDAHVGGRGLISLVILLILKFALYLMLINNWQIWWTIPAALVCSRFIMAFLIYAFPNAKKFGLAADFHRCFDKRHFWVAAIIMLILFGLFANWYFILAAFFALLLSWGIANNWGNRFGGLTGDMYGALAEWSEIIFLLLFFFALSLSANLGPLLF